MARSEPVSQVICDAGPLIHLDELECLDLLADLGTVLVPDSVWREVARYRPNALDQSVVEFTCVETLLPDEVGFQILVRALSMLVSRRHWL